jgi:hypothetical protein
MQRIERQNTQRFQFLCRLSLFPLVSINARVFMRAGKPLIMEKASVSTDMIIALERQNESSEKKTAEQEKANEEEKEDEDTENEKEKEAKDTAKVNKRAHVFFLFSCDFLVCASF